MDELAILGRGGELVDAVLVDEEPVAGADFTADAGANFVEGAIGMGCPRPAPKRLTSPSNLTLRQA